jgi:hypothetical protein
MYFTKRFTGQIFTITIKSKMKKSFPWCHNLSLGLTTKAKACKVASQEGSPGMKESVRE